MASSDPFCGNCGYNLTGLVDSSKCPECGKPLVEVLQRSRQTASRRYASETRAWGLPLVQIAIGLDEDGKMGHARAIIAIGDKATGWLAIGGFSRGLVAIGGFALGVVSLGGLTAGILPLGGTAIGLLAIGGMAFGLLALGGVAAGFVAEGGLVAGHYALGGTAVATHAIAGMNRDPAAVEFFTGLHGLVGMPMSPPASAVLIALLWLASLVFLWFVVCGVLVCAGIERPAAASDPGGL